MVLRRYSSSLCRLFSKRASCLSPLRPTMNIPMNIPAFNSRFFTKPLLFTRSFITSVPLRSSHGDENTKQPDQFVSLTFVDMNGNRKEVKAKVGESILDTAVRHRLPIIGECNGGGTPASMFGEGPSCEFCHVYLQSEYLKFINKPDWIERDRLTVIESLKYNSRLGCQISVTPELDGMVIAIPHYPHIDP